MTEPVLAGIEQVARNHLDWRGELTLDAPLAELFELDSLRLLTLVVELENHFQICLDEGDEEGLETVGDLVKLLQRRLNDPS